MVVLLAAENSVPSAGGVLAIGRLRISACTRPRHPAPGPIRGTACELLRSCPITRYLVSALSVAIKSRVGILLRGHAVLGHWDGDARARLDLANRACERAKRQHASHRSIRQ